MRRRRALQLVGAGLLGGLAGCTGETDGSGGATRTPTSFETPDATPSPAPFEHPGTLEATFGTNGDYPPDDDPADGYPPAFPDPPSAPDVDPASFEEIEVYGQLVSLAPIDVVIDWYRRGSARFVDARGLGQYEEAHVYGAVFSGAQEMASGGGIDSWDPDSRVVTYCGCPHHLSSIRASGLQKAGFSNVFALDDGFVGRETSWAEQDYPMEGTAWVGEDTPERASITLEGAVDDAHAGAYAWAVADGQYEAARIDETGRYELHLRFSGLTAETTVAVRTPSYTVTGALSELSSATIRPPDR